MFRAVAALATVALALILTTAGPSQEKKAKGQLPQGWKALDLTPEQKAQAYKVHGEYKAKIAKLQDEIKGLQMMEKADLVKILTPEQKKKLAAALLGETTDPKKADKKDEKKDEKKPAEKTDK